jgi:hypothetical protein
MALFGRETARDEQRASAWREWFIRQHPLALASAVLSIFSLTHFGTLWVDEIAGIIFGMIAIRQVRRWPERSAAMGYVGVIVGVISFVCAIVIYSMPAE